MSKLTAELMGRKLRQRLAKRWQPIFETIAGRLVEAYGVPHLGNFDDPVDEVFYIMLSARTTDAQYQKTHSLLRSRFPTLDSLAEAEISEIVPCIADGGLANKRAAHARNLAAALVRCGEDASARLRSMPAREAYYFLVNLPGMGPKSAFCVMMYSLGHDVFPVDVNVQRVAARVGALRKNLKHYQAQQQLPPLVPAGRSRELHIGMVVLGRKICLPRSPRCEECPIEDLCATGRERRRRKPIGGGKKGRH
jgi:endonuclease III